MIQQSKMGIHSLSISIALLLPTTLFIVISFSAAAGDSDNNCVYSLYVKTGSIMKGGTDSKISVTLGDGTGNSVWIPNLQHWGLMGRKYDYFERGNLDAFSGRGPCIGSPICRLNLTSDGLGSHHGWYCDYIEVTSTGPHRPCSQTVFYVDQWLARDAPPFELTAILDACHLKSDGSSRQGARHRVSYIGARHATTRSSAILRRRREQQATSFPIYIYN